MHLNFPTPASEEGVLLALGGASRAACPGGEGTVSILRPPSHPPSQRPEFGTSAGGASRLLSLGQREAAGRVAGLWAHRPEGHKLVGAAP